MDLAKIIEKRKIKRMKFGVVANKWLEFKKTSVKRSTYYKYSFMIERYLNPEFKNVKIRKIKDYSKYSQKMLEKFSVKTVKDVLCVFRSILTFYEETYFIKLSVINSKLPKLKREKIKILTSRERKKLEKYCMESEQLSDLGILMCLNTGMRIGEICALKWKNINLSSRLISIENTLQRVYDPLKCTSKVEIDKPKTVSSIRNIPINRKLYDILIPLRKKYSDENYFLTGCNERYFEPRTYQYIFKSILRTCQIKQYKFHILRHTFATTCIDVGMDAKSLSEILGHSNVKVTLDTYVHSSDHLKKKFLEKI